MPGPSPALSALEAASKGDGKVAFGQSYTVRQVDGGWLLSDCFGTPIATRPGLPELADKITEMEAACAKADAIMEKAMGYAAMRVAKAKGSRSAFAEDLVEMDIEMFSPGVWNGIPVDEAQLKSIVRNTQEKIHLLKPPLKLGHDDEQKILQNSGLPAAGWLESVRMVAGKAVGHFVGVPAKVKALAGKAYRRCSSEIMFSWRDPESGARMPVFTGLALLGADLPAVTDLADIGDLYGVYTRQSDKENQPLLATFTLEEEPMPAPEKSEAIDTSKFVERAAFDAQAKVIEGLQAKHKSIMATAAAQKVARCMAFIQDPAAPRILSRQKAAVESLLKRAQEAEVTAFAADGADTSKPSILDEVVAVLEGLPDLGKGLFAERAQDGAVVAGVVTPGAGKGAGRISEAQAVQMAQAMVDKARTEGKAMTFTEAIGIVQRTHKVQTVHAAEVARYAQSEGKATVKLNDDGDDE